MDDFHVRAIAFYYVPLGIAIGFLAIGFIKMFSATEDLFSKLKSKNTRLLIGALALGVVGIFSKDVLGNGYEYVQEILDGNTPLIVLAVTILLKPLATLQ